MGRTHAQFASLMHEAAHRLLFSQQAHQRPRRPVAARATRASPPPMRYRRVHMAHHRQEFGPDEPDIPLYRGYPISRDSLRRKLVRDATGQHRPQADARPVRATRASTDQRSRRTFWKIMRGAGACCSPPPSSAGHWWVYPVLWVAPYLTVWRVINRLRSIAEHGGMQHVDRPSRDHALGARSRCPRGSRWCRTTSAGTSPTTSTRACRSATCRACIACCTRAATSTPRSSTRRTRRCGVHCASRPRPRSRRCRARPARRSRMVDDAPLGRLDRTVRALGHRLRDRAAPPAEGSAVGLAARARCSTPRIAHAISPQGAGAHEALRLARDVLIPACRPMDDPMNLAYVPTAPTVAATMFDLVVSASSIFGGSLGGRRRRDRRREPGAALAGRSGRLPRRSRWRVRVGRLGRQPQRARHGPRGASSNATVADGRLAFAATDRGARVGARDRAGDGRRRA